uniref:Uncharacterized protein n=1 Tax=Knipowitschia caucasica TaxID=637954 RepID=A0AAV2JKA6_KNICA
MIEKAQQSATYGKTPNKKISLENKEEIQYPMNHDELIKPQFDAQSAVTLTLEPLERQRRDDANAAGANASGTSVPGQVTQDASLKEAEQQRGFCSSDSVVETESEDKSRRNCQQKDNDDYYTDERIAEWVLSVNSSLFKRGNYEEEQAKEPVEEQDVTTIKIVYSGE